MMKESEGGTFTTREMVQESEMFPIKKKEQKNHIIEKGKKKKKKKRHDDVFLVFLSSCLVLVELSS